MGAEAGGEPPTELRHLCHHGQQYRRGTGLPVPVTLQRGHGKEARTRPGIVLRKGLLGCSGERDLLLRGARACGSLDGGCRGGGLGRRGDIRGGCGRRVRFGILPGLFVGRGPERFHCLFLGNRFGLDGLVGVVIDVHAVIGGESRESRFVPLPHGTELPLTRAPVQLPEDQSAHGARVVDREPKQGFPGPVAQRQLQGAEFVEPGGLVPARRDEDRGDIARNGTQIEADPVLAALARRRLAEQLHAPVRRAGVVVEVEVRIAADLAAVVQQQHGDIGVAFAGRADPPQADDH